MSASPAATIPGAWSAVFSGQEGWIVVVVFFYLTWIQWRRFGPHLAMNRGMLTWNIWNNKKYHDAAGFWPNTKVPIWTGHSWDIVIHISVFYCIPWWCTAVIGGYDLFSHIFSKHPSASLALTKSWCTPAIHHSPALAPTAEQRHRAQWFLSAFRIYEVCGRTRGIWYADIKSSCSESEGIRFISMRISNPTSIIHFYSVW